MRRLVVLGAGTAGTMVVNKLRRRLDPDTWSITMVDQDETHLYQPGLLFVPFGRYRPAEVTKPRRRFLPGGVSLLVGLKVTMLGNTATHMPQGLGGLPGMTALATHQMRKQIRDIGVPDVPELLAQIVDSGGHLWACRMSADMMHLDESDLYEPVEGIISAADFIEKTDGAQIIFI
jgi:peroxiredoxin family protein